MITVFISVAFGIGGSMLISVSFADNLKQERKVAINSYQSVLGMLAVVNSVSHQAYYGDVVDVLRQLEENGANWAGMRLAMGGDILYESGAVSEKQWRDIQPEEGEYQVRVFKWGDNRYLQVSGSLEAGKKTMYLDGLYDISAVYQSRSLQQRIYCYVFIVIIAAGGIVSWILAYYLTKPMEELAAMTRKISKGDLSVRAEIYSQDEIGLLAEDFNHMADAVEDSIEQMKETMERQDEFMGSFAHELKTPMTAIIGYADILRSQALPPEDLREAANYIFTEGKRLENLSLKLLDLLVVKRDTLDLAETKPKKLVDEAIQLLEPSMKKQGITLEQDCEKGRCLMEPSLVMSLLINLMDNARKAMDHGGKITVTAWMTEDGCCFQIDDEGSGIPPEDIDRLTDAFYRVDKSRARTLGGVGLGLALCREIVEAHHGTLTFENRESGGTRVTAELKGGRIHETE